MLRESGTNPGPIQSSRSNSPQEDQGATLSCPIQSSYLSSVPWPGSRPEDQEVGVGGLPTPMEYISIHVPGLLLVLAASQDIALTSWGVQEGGTLPCSAASRASISWVEGMEPWGSSLSAASLASISACEGTNSAIGMGKHCKIQRNPSPRSPGWCPLGHPACLHSLGLFSWRSRARRSAMTWSWWVSPLFRGVLGFCLASKAAIRLAEYEIEALEESRREG